MYIEAIIDLSEIKTKLEELEDFCRSNPIYREKHKKEIIRYLIEPLGIYFKKHIKLLDRIYETNNTKTNKIIGKFHIDPNKRYKDKIKKKNIKTINHILPYLRIHPSYLSNLNMILSELPTNWSIKVTVLDNGLIEHNANTINTKRLLVSYYNHYKDMVNYILKNKPYESMMLL